MSEFMQEEPMLLCESPPPSQEEGSKVVERVPLHYTSIVTPLYLHCNSIVPCFTLHSWCKLAVHIISSVICVLCTVHCGELWDMIITCPSWEQGVPTLVEGNVAKKEKSFMQGMIFCITVDPNDIKYGRH